MKRNEVKKLVDAVVALLPASDYVVPVELAAEDGVVSTSVPRDQVSHFLGKLGHLEGVGYRFRDSGGGIAGAVVTVVGSADVVQDLAIRGLPLPNLHFRLRDVDQLIYFFKKPVDEDRYRDLVSQLALGLETVDARCVEPDRYQPLPDSAGEVVEIDPLVLGDPSLPPLLAQELGLEKPLGEEERERLEALLAARRLGPPKETGYRSCRGTRIVARTPQGGLLLTRREAGVQQVSTETKLAEKLLGESGRRFDLIADLAVTWACREIMAARLEAAGLPVELGLRLWMRARACLEARKLRPPARWLDATASAFLECYRLRLEGIDGAGPIRLYYDVGLRNLALIEADGRVVETGTGQNFPKGRHAHEWSATSALTVKAFWPTEKGEAPSFDFAMREADSDFDKARIGFRALQRELGLARILSHQFPLAYQGDEWFLDGATRCVRAIRVPALAGGDSTFDVVDYLDGLRERGALPFESRDDLLKFVMLLATPLLREVAPGLLGVYWLTGPPGSGKDYFAAVADRVWRAVSPNRATATVELSITDDL